MSQFNITNITGNNIIVGDNNVIKYNTKKEVTTLNLDSFMLHERRIIQLMSTIEHKVFSNKIQSLVNHPATLQKAGKNKYLTDWLVEKITNSSFFEIQPDMQLTEVESLTDKIVFANLGFYFKRSKKVFANNDLFYIEFKCSGKKLPFKITGKFSSEHFTSNSSNVQLSGHNYMLMVGIIRETGSDCIVVEPIAFSIPIHMEFSKVRQNNPHRLFFENVDEFKVLLKDEQKNLNPSLEVLRQYPERTIKHLFERIFNTQHSYKDWGGETSDLCVNNLHINQVRNSAAFLLKGPAKFAPMKLKDLGKNGDQIVRLFNEPVDIFILQHCHVVDNSVVSTMEAYAVSKNKKYIIIDGYDTLRLLINYERIHGKLLLTEQVNN